MPKARAELWVEISYPEDTKDAPTPSERLDFAVGALGAHAEENGAYLVVVRSSSYYEPAEQPTQPDTTDPADILAAE